MDTTSETTVMELANRFVNSKMNCSIENNPTKILKLLGPNKDDIDALRNFLIEERVRLDKKNEFSRWYDADIINLLGELITAVIQSNKNMDTNLSMKLVGLHIISALKEGALFKKFHWANYEFLVKDGLFSLFSDFDSKFRGDIVACHKVGGKYVVIETERYPFDYKKQNDKTYEPKEKHFYSTEVRKNGKSYVTNYITNFSFNTFESALFHTMCPNHYSAINILFESQKD